MQDLTGRFPTHLSPTSQSGGNTIQDPAGHAAAMTAPGSESVNPLPDRLDNVMSIGTDTGAATADHHGPAESGGWTTGRPSSPGWTNTP